MPRLYWADEDDGVGAIDALGLASTYGTKDWYSSIKAYLEKTSSSTPTTSTLSTQPLTTIAPTTSTSTSTSTTTKTLSTSQLTAQPAPTSISSQPIYDLDRLKSLTITKETSPELVAKTTTAIAPEKITTQTQSMWDPIKKIIEEQRAKEAAEAAAKAAAEAAAKAAPPTPPPPTFPSGSSSWYNNAGSGAPYDPTRKSAQLEPLPSIDIPVLGQVPTKYLIIGGLVAVGLFLYRRRS